MKIDPYELTVEDYHELIDFYKIPGKQIHLGYFDDKKDAIAARKAAEVKYGFHKNHGRN